MREAPDLRHVRRYHPLQQRCNLADESPNQDQRGGGVMADLSVRVGTDVESIDDVRDSIERFGARYAARIFTDHEIESCGGLTPTAAPGLAARFAAKEAVIKLLQPVDIIPTWRSIEVERIPGGASEIHLTGDAASLADSAGIASISLSMSHGAGIGTATAVALATIFTLPEGHQHL
jgi:holo-[acyl-carrier protein] synthase